MKWPNTLTAIRHGESAYNVMKTEVIDRSDAFQEFKAAYDSPNPNWDEVAKMAQEIHDSGILKLPYGNHNTPLTELGHWQAEQTGQKLGGVIALPDVVKVSPYDRTMQTYEGLVRGWPELGEVRMIEDDRFREQEHGISEIYGNWRIYLALHPDQREYFASQGRYYGRYAQGESVLDVRKRVGEGITRIMEDYKEKDVLVVTHHLTILSLRDKLERLGHKQFLYLDEHEKPINCGVTVYRGNPDQGEDGHLNLDLYNQQLY